MKKRKLLFTLLPVLVISLFCSCTNNEKIKEPDIDALSNAFIEKLSFDITPEEISPDVAYSEYALDSSLFENMKYYRSGSVMADEIAIFKVKNPDDIKKVTEAIDSRLKYLKDGFSSYKPSEVPKIEKAYVKTVGSVVIFCICNDTSVIDDIIKEI